MSLSQVVAGNNKQKTNQNSITVFDRAPILVNREFGNLGCGGNQ